MWVWKRNILSISLSVLNELSITRRNESDIRMWTRSFRNTIFSRLFMVIFFQNASIFFLKMARIERNHKLLHTYVHVLTHVQQPITCRDNVTFYMQWTSKTYHERLRFTYRSWMALKVTVNFTEVQYLINWKQSSSGPCSIQDGSSMSLK